MEVFLDMKQRPWINEHIHMYEYLGGVARILVPDNCKTAVVHKGGFKDQRINETYQEIANTMAPLLFRRVSGPQG